MNRSVFSSLRALPVGGLTRHPDIVLALGVLAVLGMLIIPLPTGLLDVFLALNLCLAGLILLTTLFAKDALGLSSFPTLLLVTTLYRLALNVSTTRMILSRGTAGEVVQGFGQFVLQGDLVVGMVVFLVITFVQFMVIAKGAERVAEVAARFTLDAMPGKQLSIDAALRAGAITDDEAQAQRLQLGRESQLYGAMDGAMKFVKGDAVAGLVITAINLVAGLVIGIVRFDLPLESAAQTYSILTIGDGLVSQLPALLITLAAGMMTTKVAPAKAGANLGQSLSSELFADPKVLALGAMLAGGLGLLPGLPLISFWGIGLCLAGLAFAQWAAAQARLEAQTSERQVFDAALRRKVEEAKHQKGLADRVIPTVVPLGIDLDPELSRSLGFADDRPPEVTELLGMLVPKLRDALFAETGVRFPGVRVRSHCVGLARGAFVLRVRDVPVFQGQLDPHRFVAMDSPRALRRLGIDAEPFAHPLTGGEVSLVRAEDTQACEDSGVPTWSAAGVIVLHLARVLKRRAREFIGLQETSELVERLEQAYPALVREVVPKLIAVPQLADILRRLVDEGVCIRDFKAILEALGEQARYETCAVALTEAVRAALSVQIAHAHAGLGGTLSALLLDPAIEDTVHGAIQSSSTGSYLALEPELGRAIVSSIQRSLAGLAPVGRRPVVLTTSAIRRYLRKLLEAELPDVSILSFEELPADLSVQPLARVSLREDALAA